MSTPSSETNHSQCQSDFENDNQLNVNRIEMEENNQNTQEVDPGLELKPQCELEKEPEPVPEAEIVEVVQATVEDQEDIVVDCPQVEELTETLHIDVEPEKTEPEIPSSEPEFQTEQEQPIDSQSSQTVTSPEQSSSPIPDTPTMDEIAPRELESLRFTENESSPIEDHTRIMQNNENETVEEKKQISPIPHSQDLMNQRTPARSGIRPPTAVLRQPKVPITTPVSAPRPSTATHSAPRTISTPRQTASTAPSPRPISKMSRERSDIQKSTSTRSIDNAGKFTPKVNAKFVNVKSKVGSVTNHKPGGGNIEIFSEKKLYTAQSKVGSMKNATHVAGGGNVQIESRKLDFSYASPKVGSKTNYQPIKSDVKIVSEKLTWQAKPKVGSMENATHKPAGGNVQILSQKLNWKAESKVGSKDNMSHRPGGGNVKIFDEKIRYVSSNSSRNTSALDISSL